MTATHPTPRRASIELVFAGMIWGSSFIAQRWALDFWSPLATLALRFTIAFLVSLPFLFLIPSIRKLSFTREARSAFMPGALLGVVLLLQNYGLKFTSVANSGFITALYVLFVPIFGAWIFKQPIPRGHARVVAFALLGAGLMCEIYRAKFNLGDLFTLACAVIGAVNIAWIGWVAPQIQSSFLFNSFQSLWIAVLALLASVVTGPIPVQGAPTRAWIGLIYQIIGATLIAFFLQIRAQRVLSSSTASILFLLEAPFAALFGFLFFREILSFPQIAGAAIILVACVWAIRLNREK